MNETRYMISDASKQLHVEAHVLRYWEDELEMEIPRTELGHRYYTEQHLLAFERIKQLKEAGYQLKAIKLILPKLTQLDTDEFEFILLVADEMNRRAAEMYEEPAAAGLNTTGSTPAGAAVLSSADDSGFQRPSGSSRPDSSSATDSSCEQTNTAPTAETAGSTLSSAAARTEPGQAAPAFAATENNESSTGTDSHRASSAISGKENLPSNVIPISRTPAELTHEERIQQFQAVMTGVVSNAMQMQARQFGDLLSEQVSEKLLKELDYLLRLRQEEEEMRFQHLDETIRSHQKSMQEAAAGRAPGKRRRRK